ncbi:PAS domain S-box protein [Shumkonia mesophila]|uniref:PAS domain S-box protein n=1 Tax=Shumkonia mesophila TaxID=2838854 RepID=UPI002934AA5F|nr:PAS domain S-box protein [Shumkonia mesophila]
MTSAGFRAGALFCGLFALVSLSVGARADDAVPRPHILVGSEFDYPPYALVTEEGEADGFSVDLMKAVGEAVGIDVTFKVGPWNEVRSALERGEIDALPLVSYSKERERVFDFSIPYIVAHGAIFKRKGAPDITSVVDLRDKHIIVMSADAGHDWLVRNDISNNLVLTPTVEESLRLLAEGKFDYALAPRLVGLLIARDLELTNLETTGPVIDAYGRGYGFAVRKGNVPLLLQLGEGLSIVKESGRYDEIYEKWFGLVDPRGVPAGVIARYALWAALGVVVLGGVAFAWISVLRNTVEARTRELREAHGGLEQLVTERTRELQDKNFILDAVIEGAADTIYVKDRDGRYLLVNRSGAEAFDVDPADMTGKTSADMFVPAVAAEMARRDRAVMETGRASDVEEVLALRGEDRMVHTYKTPYRDAEGNIIGVIGITRDITERKRAEAALAESEERMRLLLSGVAVGIGVEDLEGRTISVNEGLARMLGYTPEELKAMRFTEYTHPDHAGRDAELFAEMAAGARDGYQLEKRYITRDGSIVWGRLTRTVVKDVQGAPKYCLGMVEDITERKRAEEALRESEERFAKAFRASPAPMSISTIDDGVTLDVNDEWLAMLGYSRDEVIGKSSIELGCWGGSQRAAFIGRLRDDGSFRGFEASVLTKEGRERRVILAGETIDDGRMLLVFHDITERLRMESRLAHAQKMEAVGQLTGGIAHDFNNLLQIIHARLEIIGAAVKADDPLRNHAQSALAAAQRGGKLTQQLLSFSRRQVLRPATVDPNALIEGMVKMLARTLGEDIEIETVLDRDVPSITIDPHGLENAVLNLAINTRDAMPKGGRLSVRTSCKRLERDIVVDDETLPAGPYVEVSVTDTGSGMTPETLGHAFEPFYTTKGVGEGSGLGLSMVYGFARQSGGLATLESEVGQGTTVRMLLPLVNAAAAPARPEPRAGDAKAPVAATVLLVEDDPDVRAAVAMVLKSAGYRVREAEDGATALTVLDADASIGLVFSDVVMPRGINGFDLAREATRRRGDLKVILTSGYPESELQNSGLAKSGFRLLAKPYAKSELLETLAAMLGGEESSAGSSTRRA